MRSRQRGGLLLDRNCSTWLKHLMHYRTNAAASFGYDESRDYRSKRPHGASAWGEGPSRVSEGEPCASSPWLSLGPSISSTHHRGRGGPVMNPSKDSTAIEAAA